MGKSACELSVDNCSFRMYINFEISEGLVSALCTRSISLWLLSLSMMSEPSSRVAEGANSVAEGVETVAEDVDGTCRSELRVSWPSWDLELESGGLTANTISSVQKSAMFEITFTGWKFISDRAR